MIRGKKKKKRRKKKEEVIFRLTKKFGNLVSYQRSELSALDSRASSVQRERGRGREREREALYLRHRWKILYLQIAGDNLAGVDTANICTRDRNKGWRVGGDGGKSVHGKTM